MDEHIRRRQGRLAIRMIAAAATGLAVQLSLAGWLAAQSVDFEKEIRPLLVSHCLECHRGPEPKGGLDLSDPELLSRGGDSGPAIASGRASESLLWERVSDDEMPPKHPLGDAEKETLQKWIDQGAEWSGGTLDLFSLTTGTRAGRDWWSLQPLKNVPPPLADASWCRNEIDAFVWQRLRESGLEPAPVADPRSLIRRLYFDLTGLPPTPEEVAAFVADPSDAVYQQVVEKLLDSPRYGERWGRHWLDVVRFGESDGYERNMPREHAWPYRDWVIESLNADMPYDEFVRMQLIGDQLTDGPSGAAATGFWVAGVHNTVIGESKRMQQLARQDEIEEVLGTLGQTFAGLTFNCARCHDHKFDPITQVEYYQLSSAISGLGFGEREFVNPEELAKFQEMNDQLATLKSELVAVDGAARNSVLSGRRVDGSNPPDVSLKPASVWEFDHDLSDSIGNLHGTAHGTAHLDNGALIADGAGYVETGPIPFDITEKTLEAWVQLDDLEQRGGAAIAIGASEGGAFDAIVFGELEAKRWMTGSDFFRRSDSFGGDEETVAITRPVHLAVVYQGDGTIIGYRDGKVYGRAVRKSDLQLFKAQGAQFLFGLRHKPAGGNQFIKGKIHRASFYNRALTAEEIALSATMQVDFVSEEKLVAAMDAGMREKRDLLKARVAELSTVLDAQGQRVSTKVYSLVPGPGETTNVLLRGDPDSPDAIAMPGTTAAIEALPAHFSLAADAPEAIRRQKLTAWLTDATNPLFTRVIVNRVWHYHFGAGIVDTPSDFGFNGGRPSHPELLDYLALYFRNHGYRLKTLHRLIVNSATYRQAARGLPEEAWQKGHSRDAADRLLWRGTIRRLEAETLRDAMLMTSGQLNLAVGGPSFRDVADTHNNGTTYYEPLDVNGPEFFRRTVYRFSPRGERSALLDTFDCPDPAFTTPSRSYTTTPLQSLSLLNNPLVLHLAEHFAERVRGEAGNDLSAQVVRAWQLAIARAPDERERRLSEELVEKHGLPALCRGLFNVNEFVLIQ